MVCKKLEEEVLLKPDNPYGAVIVKSKLLIVQKLLKQ